ncbi:hypothetical protein Niako_4767 [Niastella koreensis GR20-10]|uniref:Uncharacterized protein n=1 Tax=Niastella koreensis (strain DSM 17620 / KACC 11465 / NBRC 106392 / GR20-10) TaxID=700598 RepID=G8TQ19_NIAKG|nr:hypothetical protein Niako_4767 [Niastella koreensis GR20-10]
MNKVRMIVTCIVVLCIVGTAYAITSKKGGSFCVSKTGPNQGCFVIQNMLIWPGPTDYWYQVNWDGNNASCVGSNNCPTPVHLIQG